MIRVRQPSCRVEASPHRNNFPSPSSLAQIQCTEQPQFGKVMWTGRVVPDDHRCGGEVAVANDTAGSSPAASTRGDCRRRGRRDPGRHPRALAAGPDLAVRELARRQTMQQRTPRPTRMRLQIMHLRCPVDVPRRPQRSAGLTVIQRDDRRVVR